MTLKWFLLRIPWLIMTSIALTLLYSCWVKSDIIVQDQLTENLSITGNLDLASSYSEISEYSISDNHEHYWYIGKKPDKQDELVIDGNVVVSQQWIFKYFTNTDYSEYIYILSSSSWSSYHYELISSTRGKLDEFYIKSFFGDIEVFVTNDLSYFIVKESDDFINLNWTRYSLLDIEGMSYSQEWDIEYVITYSNWVNTIKEERKSWVVQQIFNIPYTISGQEIYVSNDKNKIWFIQKYWTGYSLIILWKDNEVLVKSPVFLDYDEPWLSKDLAHYYVIHTDEQQVFVDGINYTIPKEDSSFSYDIEDVFFSEDYSNVFYTYGWFHPEYLFKNWKLITSKAENPNFELINVGIKKNTFAYLTSIWGRKFVVTHAWIKDIPKNIAQVTDVIFNKNWELMLEWFSFSGNYIFNNKEIRLSDVSDFNGMLGSYFFDSKEWNIREISNNYRGLINRTAYYTNDNLMKIVFEYTGYPWKQEILEYDFSTDTLSPYIKPQVDNSWLPPENSTPIAINIKNNRGWALYQTESWKKLSYVNWSASKIYDNIKFWSITDDGKNSIFLAVDNWVESIVIDNYEVKIVNNIACLNFYKNASNFVYLSVIDGIYNVYDKDNIIGSFELQLGQSSWISYVYLLPNKEIILKVCSTDVNWTVDCKYKTFPI